MLLFLFKFNSDLSSSALNLSQNWLSAVSSYEVYISSGDRSYLFFIFHLTDVDYFYTYSKRAVAPSASITNCKTHFFAALSRRTSLIIPRKGSLTGVEFVKKHLKSATEILLDKIHAFKYVFFHLDFVFWGILSWNIKFQFVFAVKKLWWRISLN